MKTLSLKQPWAELILQGRKSIELRKWNTNFMGKFLIHSSKKSDLSAIKKFGFDLLPCGFIVGKTEIVSVKKYKNKKEFEKDKTLHLVGSSLESFGRYGFILKNPERIELIPAKGKLNFWNFEI